LMAVGAVWCEPLSRRIPLLGKIQGFAGEFLSHTTGIATIIH
jgi:hypothetical protein